MFKNVPSAPRDAILGLTEAFRSDPRPEKINLSVGVYQDESGQTPVLEVVREAEQKMAVESASKGYLPISGLPAYAEKVQKLLFGEEYEGLQDGRATTFQTPGGTGALRVAADFLHAQLPQATVWLSDPTWANHPNIFAAAGVATKTYPYYDSTTHGLSIERMLSAIKTIPAGDVILLHACCHNPTGIDPDPSQWQAIATAVGKQGLLPLVDFAYQGFAEGVEEDATSLRRFCQDELMVCNSFSKNFGLYRERVGALSVVSNTSENSQAVESQIKRTIRTNYSNPPFHGAEIVNRVLQDEVWRTRWEQELGQMRQRIGDMRQLLVEKLIECGVQGDYSFITRQRGMFSYTGLTTAQVDLLREQHAVYIVGSGRINVAGINSANVNRLADAIGKVVGT
ncbi:MAG: amino acid aminotransferase [Pirellulales bacterium]